MKKFETPLYAYATEAHHKLGEISRFVEGKQNWEEDGFLERGVEDFSEHVCQIYAEDDDNWIGSWITGMGFFDVKFPKNVTRALTPEEIEEFKNTTFQLNSQPPYKYTKVETIK